MCIPQAWTMSSVVKSLPIFIRLPHRRVRVLIDAEVFGVPVKDQPLTRDERNVEEISTAVVPLAREAANEGVAFEQCIPHGWKIISTAHQFCAQPREVARTRHCKITSRNFAEALI